MGTRSLTAVINREGEMKVAQYGQYDGYPSKVGADVLNFLLGDGNLEKLENALQRVRFLDPQGVDKDFIEEYDRNAPEWVLGPDNRTESQKAWWRNFCHRWIAAGVLSNIINSELEEIVLLDSRETATGDGSVEWSYVIDFSKMEFSVYEHTNELAIIIYSLLELPTVEQFLSDLEAI
jgi:hypothetical protein